MLKEQIEGLMRENAILKRAVAIQHERQKEQEDRSRELQHLKQMVSQYQEQLRTLEVRIRTFAKKKSLVCFNSKIMKDLDDTFKCSIEMKYPIFDTSDMNCMDFEASHIGYVLGGTFRYISNYKGAPQCLVLLGYCPNVVCIFPSVTNGIKTKLLSKDVAG